MLQQVQTATAVAGDGTAPMDVELSTLAVEFGLSDDPAGGRD
jgi:hypothetical protein